MRTNFRSSALLIVAGAISVLQACQKDDQFNSSLSKGPHPKEGLRYYPENTFYGPAVSLGNGVARAWVKQNDKGEPIAAGVNLSGKALENLPSEPSEYILSLPGNKGKAFYTHVQLGWNPQGHEPEHVYDLPHFDVHFYAISREERNAISIDDTVQFNNLPEPKYVPPLYLRIPGGIPQMGVHWVDLLSPEFNGGIFTKTYIWGSYDGRFIFWEPMVTRDYLLTHPDVLTPLRQPAAYKQDGWYPTHYRVSYSVAPEEYTIALENLVFRKGE